MEPKVVDAPQGEDIAWMARGGLLNLIGAVSFGLGAFLFALLVARGLGVSRAGAFFEVIALFIVLTTVTQLGTSVGIVRALAHARALGRHGELRATVVVALVPVLITSGVVGALTFAFAPSIASLVIHGASRSVAVTYLRVLAAALPLSAALMTMLPATQGLGTMVPTNALDTIGQSALRVALAALLFTGITTPLYPPLIWAVPVAIAFCGALVWLSALLRRAQRHAPRQTGTASILHIARDFWRFTSVRFLAATLQIVLLWLDVILVGALRNASDAAVYTAASRYIVAGTIVNTAIIAVVQPLASACFARGEHTRLLAILQTATAWLIALAFPIYLTMAVFAPVLMGAFGERYLAGDGALRILSLAMLVSMAAGPVMVLLLMGGRSVWNLSDTFAALVVNVVLNVILIPPLGIDGAALAAMASIVVLNLVPLLQIFAWWRLHPFGPGFGRAVIASLVCFGAIPLAVQVVVGDSVTAVVLALTLAAPLYAGLLWRWRVPLELPAFRGALPYAKPV